jgi:4-amino-4-deoxy-L-arabinose transferase-like glycosyltransferase
MQKTKEKIAGLNPRLAGEVKNSVSDTNGSTGISSIRFTIELLIIVSLSALAYIALCAYWIKFSRAEVFFAECAREMLVTNNFITPLYHAQPFFDKPIFVYWLIIAMFKTLGVSHFAARLPSIVASLITIISAAAAGSYLFGKRVGLLSALMLASSFMYLSFSCLCMSDMFLVMFDTLSLMAIYAGIISEKNRTLCWWLAALSMGFAFLTKGPVGIVLPALATLIYLGWTQRLTFIKAKHIIWGLITVVIVASPWFYAAYLANGPQSMVHFFIQENLQRFAGSTYDAHRPFWYTIVSFFLGFAPWSVLIPPALFWFGKDFGGLRKRAVPVEFSAELFLWIWIFISVGFFCFSRGKCDYYTLPAFTAAAILAARYASGWQAKYLFALKSLAATVLVATIIFAALILPQINKLLPVGKYVTMIKSGPSDLRVGIDETAASWIDEILFQSGKDPVRLSDAKKIYDFMSKDGPALVIMPENKYYLLSVAQKNKYRVIASDRVATHPLTPGYLIERVGNIADPTPLVVAANFTAASK